MMTMMTMMMMMMMMMVVMMMKSDAQTAASVEVLPVSAVCGKEVVLTSDLQGGQIEAISHVNWNHNNERLLKKNKTTCDHGRCDLQKDGSLRFNHVQAEDAGNYSVEAFDKGGYCLLKKRFLLTVEDVSSSSSSSSGSSSSSSSSSLLSSVSVCSLLMFLLLIFITVFILRRRRSQRMRTAGPTEENVYMTMHSHHGNNKKEEECDYVPCDPAVSKETPITQQPSVDAEDIYV
ncbi:uncharacterized protein [Thunnus thynnus]|uniref:uncharacterized protein n=1 Tax=Thunnus thynnus TaxID=8237 RepID=UPI00352754D7